MSLRIGIDLVEVELVAQALTGPHGHHYLSRIFTEREVRDSSRRGSIDPQCLAARFAAKEATLKALLLGDEGLSPHTIEVRVSPSGRAHLELIGRAAEMAMAAGAIDLALSLAHSGRFAAALVVVECLPPTA